jgi:hypothetical protein
MMKKFRRISLQTLQYIKAGIWILRDNANIETKDQDSWTKPDREWPQEVAWNTYNKCNKDRVNRGEQLIDVDHIESKF